MDVDSAESEPPAPTPNRPVILETPKESYLLSLAHGSEFSPEGRKYDISLILEGEVEEDREDAVVLVVADKNAVKTSYEVPPLTPPADELSESKPVPPPLISDVVMDDTETAPKSSNDESQEKPQSSMQEPPTSSSRMPSPSTTVLKTDTQPDADSPAGSTGTTKKEITLPSQSSEEVPTSDAHSRIDKDTSAVKASGDKPELVAKPSQKTVFKHPVAQVLQRRVGEDMFRFTEEGVNIADGEDSMRTEWLVQVKSWKWATRKIVRV